MPCKSCTTGVDFGPSTSTCMMSCLEPKRRPSHKNLLYGRRKKLIIGVPRGGDAHPGPSSSPGRTQALRTSHSYPVVWARDVETRNRMKRKSTLGPCLGAVLVADGRCSFPNKRCISANFGVQEEGCGGESNDLIRPAISLILLTTI
jgi:hypothetical protein